MVPIEFKLMDIRQISLFDFFFFAFIVMSMLARHLLLTFYLFYAIPSHLFFQAKFTIKHCRFLDNVGKNSEQTFVNALLMEGQIFASASEEGLEHHLFIVIQKK